MSDRVQMLYEMVTRARNELNIVVIKNFPLFEKLELIYQIMIEQVHIVILFLKFIFLCIYSKHFILYEMLLVRTNIFFRKI